MSSLSLALYCEGNTDRDFLPTIIQRTAQDILNKRARRYVEVLAVDVVAGISKQKDGQDILEAAMQMYGYHAMVIHKDADRGKPSIGPASLCYPRSLPAK